MSLYYVVFGSFGDAGNVFEVFAHEFIVIQEAVCHDQKTAIRFEEIWRARDELIGHRFVDRTALVEGWIGDN